MTFDRKRIIILTLLSWLAMIGIDFLLHGGLLASLYMEESPFLLSAEDAFRLIPVGYLSFLLLAVLLAWLMVRNDVTGWGSGFWFALRLGALIWASLTLGLFSISTANPLLLIGWFAGQTVEMGIAGGILGTGLQGTRLSRLSLIVAGILLGAIVITIILQSTGIAPQMKMTN